MHETRILGFELLFYVLVQLLVASGGLGGVKVAAANDVAVGSGEIERLGDGLKRLG